MKYGRSYMYLVSCVYFFEKFWLSLVLKTEQGHESSNRGMRMAENFLFNGKRSNGIIEENFNATLLGLGADWYITGW